MKVSRGTPTAVWAAAVVAVLVPAGAHAQIAWEAPLLVAPHSPAGFSFLVAEMDPADGVAGMVAWRQRTAPGSIGFRVGLGEGAGNDVAGFGAFDYSGPIHTRSESFPLDVAWVTGAGVGVGNNVILSAPLGVSFAYEMTAPDIWFNPYITPLVALDWYLGGEGDDFDLGFAVDIGADLAFAASWAIRFGATVGDRQGLAVGIHFPGVQLGG